MAPKLRRPAAAKAAAKVLPRPGRVRGLRRAVRRRPVCAREPEAPEEKLEERWEKNEFIEATKVPTALLRKGVQTVAEGSYYGGEVKIAGQILSVVLLLNDTVEVQVKGEGTSNEGLLKWVSGNRGEAVTIHLCGTTCPAKVDAEGLVHAEKVRLRSQADVGTWADNLVEERDELAVLRREAEEREKAERDLAKKKEDAKEKAKEKEKKKKRNRGSSSEGSKKKKKRRKGVKVEGQKTLDSCFKNTGLDQSPRVRQKIKDR